MNPKTPRPRRARRAKILLLAAMAFGATGTTGCDWKMVAQILPVVGTVLQQVGGMMVSLPGQVQGAMGAGGGGGMAPTSTPMQGLPPTTTGGNSNAMTGGQSGPPPSQPEENIPAAPETATDGFLNQPTNSAPDAALVDNRPTPGSDVLGPAVQPEDGIDLEQETFA